MIRALIFDFDGLILDTETPEYDAWRTFYANFGVELPLEKFISAIGSSYAEAGFDPFDHLVELTGASLDRHSVEQSLFDERVAIIDRQPTLPGVVDHLRDAKQAGMKVAVASSSSRRWVARHLQRLELLDQFDAVRTRDDVANIKPAPDLYLAALQALNVQPDETLVYEDSANGVTAANAAGIFTVAVPNRMTRHLDLSHANTTLNSLADVSLDEIISMAANGRK